MSGVSFQIPTGVLRFGAAQKPDNGQVRRDNANSKKFSASNEENPINEKGEKLALIPAVFGAGLLLPLRIACSDFGRNIKFADFLIDVFFDCFKPKNLAAFAGLTCLGAALYTIVKLPEISYKAKKNAFTKGKDMDVYISSNKISKRLYDEFIEKTKNATPAEKEKLWQQYLKLNAAKENAPKFVKINKDVSKAMNREFSQKMPPMSVTVNNSGSAN